nr:putative DNA-binding domain-containing protein [Neptunicella marina]
MQLVFTQHLRDPSVNVAPADIEARRMKIYSELIFNNIAGFISNGFPVLKQIYSESDWHRLIRQFIKTHHSHSPYFVDICAEFLEYLNGEHQFTQADPIFLCELAHYEWIELELSLRQSSKKYDWHLTSELPEQVCLSELCEVVAYPFEVHKISPDFVPTKPDEMTFLLVYRDPQFEIKFSQLNGLTAHMLTIIRDKDIINTRDLIERLTKQFPQISAEQMSLGCKDVLLTFLEQRVLAAGYQSIKSNS